MSGESKTIWSGVEIRPDPESPGKYLLRHPLTLKYARLTAEQAAVARRLDSTRSLDEIAADASEATGSVITTAQVEVFAANLRRAGFIGEDGQTSPRRREFGARRIAGSILSVKIHAFNPDRCLAALEKRLRFLWSPVFAVASWMCVAAAVVISVVNHEKLFQSLVSLVSIYSLPLVFAVVFAVMTIHEFGHGLALKHLGGRVEQSGLLILYFMPAFYCNLDDAWRMPKRERILVSLAGGYAQLVVWALATVAWRLLSEETLASRLCLVAIGFCGVQTLFNFNPLLRLDGYYVLSDALGIPNLRSRSFSYLGRRFVDALTGSRRTPVEPPRERRILAAYGLAAVVFSGFILWLMLSRVASWVVQEYGGWGIVALSLLMVLLVPTLKPHEGQIPKETPETRSRTRRLLPRLAVLAAAIVVLLLPWELKVSGDFTVLPLEKATVNPQVEGTLKAVFVDEGSRVGKGDLIAEMENLDLMNEVGQTQGDLVARRAQLELLKAGTRKEELENARRLVETRRSELEAASRVQQERTVLMEAVARKEAQVRNATRTLERSRQLKDQGLIPANEVDRDETAHEVLRKELNEAQGQLRVLEERTSRTRDVKRKEFEQAQSALAILVAGTRPEVIRESEAQVARLEEKLRVLGSQLEHLKIRSQISGVVATRDLRNRIGQYLEKGTLLCEIVSNSGVIVDMPVPEKEIADVSKDFPITLKVRGYPALSFQARVESIGAVASEQSAERMVVIRGSLPNEEGRLKPGMTGVGKILCGKRMIGTLATRRFVRWLRTEFWEYLP